MDEFESAQAEMEELIASIRSVILASSGSKGEPLSSYAPVFVDESRHFFVYISSMAKHTSQIRRSKLASAMLIEDESTADNLFARKRLTVDCSAQVVERGTSEWRSSMDALEARHGETVASLKGLVDFDLFELSPIEGRLVLGFGRAYRVFGERLQDIGYVGGGGHRSK